PRALLYARCARGRSESPTIRNRPLKPPSNPDVEPVDFASALFAGTLRVPAGFDVPRPPDVVVRLVETVAGMPRFPASSTACTDTLCTCAAEIVIDWAEPAAPGVGTPLVSACPSTFTM